MNIKNYRTHLYTRYTKQTPVTSTLVYTPASPSTLTHTPPPTPTPVCPGIRSAATHTYVSWHSKHGHECKWCIKKCAQVYQSEGDFSINTFKVRKNVYSKHMQNKIKDMAYTPLCLLKAEYISLQCATKRGHKFCPRFVKMSSLWRC